MLLKEGSRDWWFVAAVVVLSIGANLPESITHQFSFDRRILLLSLVAIVVVSLVKYLRLTLVIVTLALALGANLPPKLAQEFGVDPVIMFFSLFVLVLIPLANRLLKFIPTGLEAKHISKSSHGLKLLFTAAMKGDVPVVQRLVDVGVNVNGRTVSGLTPLMAAASRGYSDIVELLIHAGAEVNSKDNRGRTALLLAESLGFSRTVAFLKRAGGSV